MSMHKTPIGAMLKVNSHFLMAFLFAGGSWLIWPTSLKWWGLGLMSILLGAGAVTYLIAAFRDMVKLYIRERELARFSATARAPAPSDLADQKALKNAGMFDE